MGQSSKSRKPISPRQDLQKLIDIGYLLEIKAGHLIVSHVPYVSKEKKVKSGQFVSRLSNESQVTPPPDHTIYFVGEYPCKDDGTPLKAGLECQGDGSTRTELAEGIWIDYQFSAKPEEGNYEDYFHQMTHYAQALGKYAERIDPDSTKRGTGQLLLSDDQHSPFRFMDTASSRAGITYLNEKMSTQKIGIVGLGGTGSYILDYVSKTYVKEIRLFDSDLFEQHSALRSPGPTSYESFNNRETKVHVYSERYTTMRNGIIPHECNINPDNINMLNDLDFVFIALDDAKTRVWLHQKLDEVDKPFVDVGMGVVNRENKLEGHVRTSFCEVRKSSAKPSGNSNKQDREEYDRNIQIAELNALNASLAVIRWKKHLGFYKDERNEKKSTYNIEANHMSNTVSEDSGN